MPIKKIIFPFLLITLVVSCDQKQVEGKQQFNELWQLEEAIYTSGKDVDIVPLNQGIEKALTVRLPWAYSPLSIAMKIAGQQMVSNEVNMASKSLTGDELVTEVAVLIEKKGFPTQNIEKEYFWIRLQLGGSVWQVNEVKHAWLCKGNAKKLGAEKCE